MELRIDPEFEGKIPPLTEEEFRQLEENILADGIVINPIIIWNGVITLEELLEDHESYRKDFDELREEYESEGYDKFLVQLSWSDLPYRRATKEFIEKAGSIRTNPYVEAFIDQFAQLAQSIILIQENIFKE